jgi:hypothetical protein
MVKVEPIVKTTTVTEGFKVELTAAQLLYIVAVIGATVVTGSIPRESQGLYDALLQPLEDAGLVTTDWDVPEGLTTNEDGVPYASTLFEHLGLRQFARG